MTIQFLEEIKMPIYEYVCPKCNTRFEDIRSTSKADDEALCPECKTPSARGVSGFACRGIDSCGGGGGGSCSSGSCSSCSGCH
ncbi:hypothetical protein GY50_1297 [Dehalococcoides mccartyi GY50]|uniref:Putative regulatory protein FmdB zinc ribbon domain-containing protein n=2 Tax=Dehalococcoidaceae TaxID=1202464 RepID=D2BJ52_DEHMV|nr:hypothetical protein DhcVS_1245 [Dehalococcoides mccartyi VS]AHB14068.1 hypothetical protein GY50_1297 [Dehalococcoides mccartyi GY50]